MKNVLWGLLLSSIFAVSGCALILVGSSGENSVRSREKYEDPGEWLKIAPKPNLWLENDEWLNSENWGGVSDRHENVWPLDTLPGEERSSESGDLPAEFTRYQYIYTFCNVRWGVAENVWQTDNREYIFSGLVIKTGDRWDIVPSPYYIEKDGVRYTVTSLNGKAVQIYSNKVRTAASEESLEQQLRDGNCGWLGDGTLRNIFVVGDSVGFAYMDGDTSYVDFPNFINVTLALDSTANNYQLSIQGDPPVLIRRRTYDLQITDSIIVHRENGVELSRDTIRAAAVEIDPAFTASPASGILAGDIVNWNSAYSWGDHSVAGYLTSEVDGSITNEIQNLTIDSAVGSFTVGISGGNTIKFSKGSGGLNNIVEDLTPELGGNLGAGGFNIESLGDVTFKTGVQGGTLKTGTSNADKFELQAYDVDNATYRTVIELDAGNTVRMQMIANYLELEDEGDRTKVGRFDVSGITTGTERTYRFPDSTGKLALLSNIPANQTLSWNGGTGQLSVSGGNTVDLDGRYLESFTETDPIWISDSSNYATKSYVNANSSLPSGPSGSIQFNRADTLAGTDSLKYHYTSGKVDFPSFTSNGYAPTGASNLYTLWNPSGDAELRIHRTSPSSQYLTIKFQDIISSAGNPININSGNGAGADMTVHNTGYISARPTNGSNFTVSAKTGQSNFVHYWSGGIGMFSDGPNRRLGLYVGTTPSAMLDVYGDAIFNSASGDFDFRVNDDLGNPMLFVDAGLSRVGIGTATPGYPLDVNGQLNFTGFLSRAGYTMIGTAGSNEFFDLRNAAKSVRTHLNSVGTSYLIESPLVIGEAGIDGSAFLEIESTTKGFLPPRMTSAQRDAIATPATGLMVYNSTDSTYSVRRNSGWQNVAFLGDLNIANWNTAFGWGNHATQGYLLSEVDGSTTNELQSLSWNGGTGILTITAGNSVDLDGRYLQTEVDGSITNEGALSVGAGAANTSQILSNTSGSVAVTLVASTGIDLTETPGTGGTISIINSLPDQTVSITGGGINSVTGTYPNFTVTGTEVDGSISNEGSLTVGAGTATTSLIQSNTSGSTPVTLEAGANITLSEVGSTITIAASGGAGGETNTASNLGAGVGVYEQKVGVDLQLNSLVSGNTNVLTISEDDPNNEIDFTILTGAVQNGAVTLTTGNDVFDYIFAQGFLTSEVDGSITNEGSLSVGAGAANTSLIQSNTSGSADVTISGGTGVLVTEAGNTITVDSDVDAVGIDINTYTPTNGGSISVDFESKARKIVEVNTTNITTGFTMNVTNGWNTAGKAAVYNIRFYNSTANVRTVTLDAGDTWYDEKGNAITSLSLASGEDKILTMYTTNGSIWYTME